MGDCRGYQLLVPVGIERRKLRGVVASVSRAPHQVQHCGMRTTHGVAFRSFFVAQIRDSGFGYWRQSPSTTNSESVKFCFRIFFRVVATQNKRGFVVRNFSLLGPFVTFCGREYFATGRSVDRIFCAKAVRSQGRRAHRPFFFFRNICRIMDLTVVVRISLGDLEQTIRKKNCRCTSIDFEEGLEGYCKYS